MWTLAVFFLHQKGREEKRRRRKERKRRKKERRLQLACRPLPERGERPTRRRSAEPIPKRDRPTEAPNSARKRKRKEKRKRERRRKERKKKKRKRRKQEEQEGRGGSHTLTLAEALLCQGRSHMSAHVDFGVFLFCSSKGRPPCFRKLEFSKARGFQQPEFFKNSSFRTLGFVKNSSF